MAIAAVNLVLTTIILILGIWAYAKKKYGNALLVGIGFGLFGVSHLATLMGLASALTAPLIVVRTIGYLLVVTALIVILRRK